MAAQGRKLAAGWGAQQERPGTGGELVWAGTGGELERAGTGGGLEQKRTELGHGHEAEQKRGLRVERDNGKNRGVVNGGAPVGGPLCPSMRAGNYGPNAYSWGRNSRDRRPTAYWKRVMGAQKGKGQMTQGRQGAG